MPARRLFLWALVVSLSATAAIAIATLVFAEFDDAAARILATTALIAGTSLVSLPAGILIDQSRARPLAWTLATLAVTAFALFQVIVWHDVGDTTGKLAGTFALFAGATSQTAALTARLRPEDTARVRRIYVLSILLATALAALATAAIWAEIDEPGYYRALGAVAVANVLAALLQPILRRLGGPVRKGAELVFRLDRAASAEAVAAAEQALERHGVRVEEVVGPRV